jgi:putative hemolysin
LDPDPLPLLSLPLILSNIIWVQFGLVVFLLICSALVSGAEVAFFSLQLKSLEESNETDFPEPLITIWEPRAYPRFY